ncbi:hypothetical protein DFP72DRAFT_1075687 [Ephemerocybe angulata]|uniref:Uncharacterized protein n=1 Tax=Ephemerocybe angulata TaxID=980116 RepID=A0A8H6HHE4_9AGAR|nr:hypothetical protein DFP72DRAFT_1075687 [Tulosesus angulatus]
MAKWLGGSKESGLGVNSIVAESAGTKGLDGIPKLSLSSLPPACPLSRRRLTLTSTLLGGRNSVASSSFDIDSTPCLHFLALRTAALHRVSTSLSLPSTSPACSQGISVAESQKELTLSFPGARRSPPTQNGIVASDPQDHSDRQTAPRHCRRRQRPVHQFPMEHLRGRAEHTFTKCSPDADPYILYHSPPALIRATPEIAVLQRRPPVGNKSARRTPIHIYFTIPRLRADPNDTRNRR